MNCPGSQNDRTAFKFSGFDKLLDPLPPGYFIVGDAAYPASDRVLVPYPGKNLPVSQDSYNYYQSQCRMAIEQTFGIMVSRDCVTAFSGVEIKRCDPIGRGMVPVQSILSYGGGFQKASRSGHKAVLEAWYVWTMFSPKITHGVRSRRY